MSYDFDLPLPSMTETLIKYSTIAANYGLLLVPAVLLGGPIVLVACNTWAFSLASWLIPPLELFRLRRHGVWLMHALATLVRNGRPLTPSLAVLAERYPRAIIGRRIARAVQQTEAGIPWTAALRHQGLISSYDAALLAAAERNNHLAWALEEAAEGVERRREIRMKYLSNVLLPVVLLLLGTTVAMIVIALFVPLIALIQGLAGSR
jgi:type IV pilus assembly protein PilC